MTRREVRVKGTVQGVGFRPFVHRLATSLGLAGSVRNTAAGVVIEVAGDPATLDEFERRLVAEAPPLARITGVTATGLAPGQVSGFSIVESAPGARPAALLPPDVALCPDCAREIAALHDRRAGYPFTNCTNCGPRFTLVRGLPYDRPQTTMVAFAMCRDCAAEYRDPADRRFHAEPIACPACGPRLFLDGAEAPQAIAQVAAWLAEGKVIALKGLGGYHLACDARNADAMETLRLRKRRGQKPFAVMVRDPEEARRVAEVSDRAAALLSSPESPVVILPARAEGGLAPGVAPRQATVGVMLPYTPLHRLLLDQSPPALVMTSGNLAEEPIVHDDAEAVRKLGPIVDHVLSHNREIVVPCDDSVVRVAGDLVLPVRRARGYVPRAIPVAISAPPVLAVGGHHKSTFCLLKDGEAILSQHIGDLDSVEVMEYFARAVAHFRQLFQVEPATVAHDLHPGYLSTQFARSLPGVELVAVQHHHAHAVSVMAEVGLSDPVTGVIYDGTGYGEEGAIWGGEILLADRVDYTRVTHLRPVPMPGGEAAVTHPARMALAYLREAFGAEEGEARAAELLPGLSATERRVVLRALVRGLNAPLTSSMGRLFDAVGALLGATQEVTYEGQPAMELEAMAGEVEGGAYAYALTAEGIDVRPMVREIADDLRRGADRAVVAGRFHETVVAFTIDACRGIHAAGGPADVVLGGGVMQNARLVARLVAQLGRAGLRPHVHREVPPNDGGLSLGQAVTAAARGKE